MMKMHKSVTFIFLTIITFSLSACQQDEETPDVGPDKIIVVNEGNFGEGNGSITLYDPDNQSVENNVFDKANGGELGASIQSVSIHQDRAFMVCFATDKIEIVNPETFERLAAPIEDTAIITPRYLAVAGNKAYISVWGAFDENNSLNNSKVVVLDLNDYSIVKIIDTDSGSEDVLAVGNKVFVANSFSNTISVINTQTDQIDTTLAINTGPVQMELDQNDLLWISTTGGFDGTPQFLQIDPETYKIKATVPAEGSGATGKFAMNADRDSLFFIGAAPYPATETTVYAMSITASAISENPLISGNSFYGIGIDPETNILYLGDANSFQGEGTVLRYNTNGTLTDNFPVGVGPNGFVFR